METRCNIPFHKITTAHRQRRLATENSELAWEPANIQQTRKGEEGVLNINTAADVFNLNNHHYLDTFTSGLVLMVVQREGLIIILTQIILVLTFIDQSLGAATLS